MSIHHETIYQYLLKDKQLGGFLYKHLLHKGIPYRKYGNKHSRNGNPNIVVVEHRPEIVNNSMRVGDWELDTIIYNTPSKKLHV